MVEIRIKKILTHLENSNKIFTNHQNLAHFCTVEEFEEYHKAYTKECLDNGLGRRVSIHCFVAEGTSG